MKPTEGHFTEEVEARSGERGRRKSDVRRESVRKRSNSTLTSLPGGQPAAL